MCLIHEYLWKCLKSLYQRERMKVVLVVDPVVGVLVGGGGEGG